MVVKVQSTCRILLRNCAIIDKISVRTGGQTSIFYLPEPMEGWWQMTGAVKTKTDIKNRAGTLPESQ
jgi:hypothetical protein